MAITSSSQVLDTSKVTAATAYLTSAISDLRLAKGYLESGIKFSNYDIFHTNQGNPIPDTANQVIACIDKRIAEIEQLKIDVEARAQEIHNSEYAQYQEYLRDQEEKKNNTPEAQALPYYDNGNNNYKTLPYSDSDAGKIYYL